MTDIKFTASHGHLARVEPLSPKGVDYFARAPHLLEEVFIVTYLQAAVWARDLERKGYRVSVVFES